MPEASALLPILAAALAAVSWCLAAGHIVLSKREVRAAIGWVVVVSVAPLLGALAYWIFGVNRINRRAIRMRRRSPTVSGTRRPASDTVATFGVAGLGRFLDRLLPRQRLPGNRVTPLVGGETAFGAMLEAIERAERSVTLTTYIFDRDATGLQFGEALERAQRRGVAVRVLIDAVGARYSAPTMVSELHRRDVPVAVFLPTRVPWRFPYFNLRNHRKALVVDGGEAFVGGMNIRHGHRETIAERGAVRDVQFHVIGPVVGEIQSVFAEDWQFTTRESLAGDAFFPELERCGDVEIRVVSDGPDHELNRILWTLFAALACAERRVRVVTPYFLPDQGLDHALQIAAHRGVEVDIVLPQVGNLRLVDWASRAYWRDMVENGCRVWLTPPPFDHSKLVIVDDEWSMIGSANLDPRSLRLNFELNLACRDRALNAAIDAIIEDKKRNAVELDLPACCGWSLHQRLFYGAVRLSTPYL
jgi:cardiolipin synthase